MVDRELNPEGSEFKPLRAIYDPAFEVSDNAVVQDNVEKCIAVIEGRVRTKKVAKEEEEEKKGGEVVKLERQFKPEQLAQPTRPRRLKKGVLERMKEVEGPLGGLRKLVEQGIKARVWTRGVQVSDVNQKDMFAYSSFILESRSGVPPSPCFPIFLARTTFVLESLPEAKNPGQDAFLGDFVFNSSYSRDNSLLD